MLPQVLLSPFIGTWVDRGDRRLILIAADSTVAGATVILAILFASGLIQVWHIYLALFLRAVAGGFHVTAPVHAGRRQGRYGSDPDARAKSVML